MSEKKQILLVDDEPSIVRVVGKRLEVEGFSVRVAMDGQEALREVRSEPPDLILLDLMLPKLNGYEVCTMLKQDARYQKIPVVMFTAKSRMKDEQLGMECGADAYVRKPFKTQVLLEAIRKWLPAAAVEGAEAK